MHRAHRSLTLTFILGLHLLLVACGSGGGGGGGGPSGIGPDGGIGTSSDGRASVNILPGALSQDTAIAVAVASSLPSGNIGTAYDFGPDGTLFSQPVTISIDYDDTTLPGGVTESNLTLGTVSNNQWTPVANATVDIAANVVSGATTHFSVYGVIAISDSGPASVPNVVELSQADAETAITGAGLVVGSVTQANSATVPAGSVVSESPVAGTSVAAGSAVNLVVSTGLVSVPNVVGFTLANAQTAISGAGLVVGSVGMVSSATVPSGNVISENPTAGTSVEPGTAVNLVISDNWELPNRRE